MRSLAILVLVVSSISPALAQTGVDYSDLEKLRRELAEVEAMTERFRRFIPATFDLEEDRRRIAAAGEKLDLPRSELRHVSTERTAPLETHKVELTGEGSYSGAHFLLYMLSLRRPLQSARFEARDGGEVRFVVRFDYPVWAAGESPDARSGDPVADTRRRLERKRAELDVAVAAVDRAIVQGSADALATFTREIEPERIALTTATLGDVLTIEGVAAGSRARAALEQALDKSRLRPARIAWSPQGRCTAFTIVTSAERPLDAPMERELADTGIAFDAASARFCSEEEPATPRRIRTGSPDAPPFLKMRGVNLADAFFIFNDLFNENFIVDGDVTGRVDLDARADGSLDELWGSLAGAGIHVGPKPLRRVSTGEPLPAGSAGTGEPVSITLRDAALSDILCLLKQITARDIRMSASQQSRLSVYAYEVPSGLIADALTPARNDGAADPCGLPGPVRPRIARVELPGVAEWPVVDLRVAAVAMLPSGPKAYVYAPSGLMFPIESGTELRNGRAKTITADGVTFEIAGSEVWLSLK